MLSIISLVFVLSSLASEPEESKTRYYKHEINIGFGVMELDKQWNDLEDEMKEILPIGSEHAEGGYMFFPSFRNSSRGLRISYYYHFNHNVAVGLLTAFTSHDSSLDEYQEVDDVDYYIRTQHQDRIGQKYVIWTNNNCKLKSNSVFVVPSAKWCWLNSSWCSLYSKASVGLHYQRMKATSETLPKEQVDNAKVSKLRLAYMLTPIGWEVGIQQLRAFLEFGIGSNSNIQIGLTYRFGRY